MIRTRQKGHFRMIPVGRVHPPPFRFRTEPVDISDLIPSIRKFNLLHPILVRPVRQGYEVIAGYRRLLAFRELRLGEIPAFIRDLDSREALEIRLTENGRRLPLSLQERERILDHLQSIFITRTEEELRAWIDGVEPAAAPPEFPDPRKDDMLIPPEDIDLFFDEPIHPADMPDPEPTPFDLEPLEPLDPLDPLQPLEPVPPPERRPETTIIDFHRIPDKNRLEAPGEPPTLSAVPSADPEAPELLQAREPDTPEKQPAASKKKKAPKQKKPRPLPLRVRKLLNDVARRSDFDPELMRECTAEILDHLYHEPPVRFLQMSYTLPPEKYLPEHSINTAKLASYIARVIGFPEVEILQVIEIGLLHDVGLLKISPSILNKVTPLTARQSSRIQNHPEKGASLIERFEEIEPIVVRCIREHHERPNALGYPNTLGAEEIHPLARLIMVADTYEALVSPRVYKMPVLPHKAMLMLRRGSHELEYDVEVVGAFIRALSFYPIGSYLKMESGDIAQVVENNETNPLRPSIQIVADRNMNLTPDQPVLNLATAPEIRFEPTPRP